VESACLDSLRLLGGPAADRLCERRHHCAASGSRDTGCGCRYRDILQWESLVADQHAALARLVASAHALADAPIWLVGAGPIIDAALAAAPQRGRGPVSGVVVTSVTSSSGSCSESVLYSDPGTGAVPKIEVRKSGDCEVGSPGVTGRQPTVLPAPPAARPGAPRIIEASAGPKDLPPSAQVRRLAQLIKTSPSS